VCLLLLDRLYVQAPFVILDPHAEFVLSQYAQQLELRGDVL